MALVSGRRSTLNPNAPLFIPSSVRAVEDFSLEWWNLMNSATWFHDYWLGQQQGAEYDTDYVVSLLPDTIDLDVDDDILNMEAQYEEFLQSTANEQTHLPSPTGFKAMLEYGLTKHRDSLMRSLSFPKEREFRPCVEAPKYYEKPAKSVSPKWNTHIIHHPR